jgi:hypothetical protein
LLEVTEALVEAGLRFLIMGGHAAAGCHETTSHWDLGLDLSTMARRFLPQRLAAQTRA